MIIKRALFLFITFASLNAVAQSDYEKIALSYFMKGEYKNALVQLEKADAKTPNNTNILKLLGYAYFQCGDNENAVTTYSKFLAIKADDNAAYYYRGKARLNIANAPKDATNPMRETFYQAAIKDFSKAIELNTENDAQYYQNRGIAYKDYGIFKSYKIKKSVDKVAVVALFNNSIADFQKILVVQPLRKDIITLSKFVSDQIASLK